MSEAAPPPDQGLPPSFAHEAPTGWVTGIFNKAKNGHAKQFELAQEECEKRARASGWRPRERSEWAGWSDADPSCYIHNALQQLGVGVGHELYGELMAEVDARDIMVREKKQTVERLGLTKILGRHMINVASLNDLLAVFFLNRLCLKSYSRWGQAAMKKEEDRATAEDKKTEQEKEARWRSAGRGDAPVPRRLPPWYTRREQSGPTQRTGPANTTVPLSLIDPKLLWHTGGNLDSSGSASHCLSTLPTPMTMPDVVDLTTSAAATPARRLVVAGFTNPVTPAPALSSASRVSPAAAPRDALTKDVQTDGQTCEQAGEGVVAQEATEGSSDSTEGPMEFFQKYRERQRLSQEERRLQRAQRRRR